jgi:hypothetical protein
MNPHLVPSKVSFALVPAALLLLACGPREAILAGPPARQRAVILLTLDGVRPRDVFLGVERQRALDAGLEEGAVVPARELMPELWSLVERQGVFLGAPGLGARVTAGGPRYVSQPGYLEMASGTTAHGCPDNKCGKTSLDTWLDACGSMPDASPTDAMLVGSWERLALVASGGAGRVVVSAGRQDGEGLELLRTDLPGARLLDEGARASAYPGEAGYRPDAFTAPLALHALERFRPRCAWIALGDTDEWAHRDSYPAYLASLREADRFIGALARLVAAESVRGRDTLVLIATDHGRASTFRHHGGFPESADIWLAAFSPALRGRGLLAPASPRGLVDVAPTLLAWLLAPPLAAAQGSPLPELLPRSADDSIDQ